MQSQVIEDHGEREWSLAVEDGEVYARKMVPYDGTLTYTTEERLHVSARKNSQYNLSVGEVVDRFVQKSGTESSRVQLYADVMEVLE